MRTYLYTDMMIVALSYVLSLGLCVVLRKILIKESLLDLPNERSLHKKAVPRGAGIALMIVILGGMILATFVDQHLILYAGLLSGTLLLAGISWYDDCYGASPLVRLGTHILAAYLGSLLLTSQSLLFQGYLPLWLDRMILIVGWTWFINLYNFMDGIDGMTGMETISLAIGTLLVSLLVHAFDPFNTVLVALLTGSCLGFLTLNWHPAKIFLGDVGSVPLGYLTGYLLISLACKGQGLPAFIIASYYLADSGITLTVRAYKGEKLWLPHRQHFYQRATQVVVRHDRVVWLIALLNATLMGAALISIYYPWPGLIVASLCIAFSLRKMHKISKLTN